ncbi:MAG: hypothetical protein EPN35_14900 [Rhodanobacter sp.]|uniref:hypothetical protein n=1 Tax=Rhodanobacter TaxID=75309 RepID=UPI00120443A7|nr:MULTISPECIES: hypothetical protein [Rhodanobacter]TAN14605.1 MAG: hypothetical protein EPN35_14900 [Rhodanobacter sp.]UJJ55212.1 hypothetical protein LRK53_02070 [Rhodanobacter thiooxydans]
MILKAAPHLCPGKLHTAFVFSVPGRHEEKGSQPVAGATGTNLNNALAILHVRRPDLFESSEKYDYRITNAYHKPIWPKQNNGRSEATADEIKGPSNRDRVVRELEDCTLIVWCGKKAQHVERLVANRLARKIHIEVPHLSPRALWSLKVPPGSPSLEGATVYEARIELWVARVLEQCDRPVR